MTLTNEVFDTLLKGDSKKLRAQIKDYLDAVTQEPERREEFLILLVLYLTGEMGNKLDAIKLSATELVAQYIRQADPAISHKRAFNKAVEEVKDLMAGLDVKEEDEDA